ncbi:MAG: hypothetical protein IPP17_02165 [Bacteroidetes bacterium]|nr:hypothetical protein [Bacteroidota bacterium]
MKKYAFFLLIATTLLLAGCDSNPAWVGPKPKEKADGLAAETCKCLYEMVGKEPGWNLDELMEATKSIYKAHQTDLQAAIFESDNPAVLKAMEGEEDFSMKMDDCECMKPVQDGLLEKGVAFEEMMERLDKKCLLGAFYN